MYSSSDRLGVSQLASFSSKKKDSPTSARGIPALMCPFTKSSK